MKLEIDVVFLLQQGFISSYIFLHTIFRLSLSEDTTSDQAQTCCNERYLPSASSEAHQMKYSSPYNSKPINIMTIKKNYKK